MQTLPLAHDTGKRESARILVDAALKYASKGWRMFPVKAGDKDPPLIKAWPEKATCSAEKIEAWAKQFPGCNWGVATGAASDIFAVDEDGHVGRASLAAIEDTYGKLPATLTSRTGRADGGAHRFFACSAGVVIGNRGLGKGLHVRGERGYAIVPPCRHPSGATYEWINPEMPVASPPAWLLRLLAPTSSALAREGRIIPNERRNSTLASIAGALRRNGATEKEIFAELLIARDRCELDQNGNPFSEEEARKIAKSVSRYNPAATPNALQPLQNFIRAAVDKNGLDFVSHTKWVSPLFGFARILKGRPELRAMDGYAAAQALDIHLSELSPAGEPWHNIFGEISDDPRVEFIKTFDSVRAPAFESPLTIAHEAAKSFPLKPLRIYSPKYAQFVSLAAHLQRAYPGEPVALPLEPIGAVLGSHRTMIGNYRRMAEKDGLLTKITEHIIHKRAARFKFHVDQFDWKTGDQMTHSP